MKLFIKRLIEPFRRFFAGPRWRHVSRQFGIPRFHTFEVVAMRILFAYLLYQTMPLGEPFSSSGLTMVEAVIPGSVVEEAVSDPDRDQMLRPPLPPISKLLPNSEGVIPYDVQKQPNGIAQFMDLTFFSDPDFVRRLPWIVIPCLILYAAGFGLPVALPVLCFISIGSRTLYNSQGFIHHGFNMVSLVLLAQTIVVLWWFARRPLEAMGVAKPTRVRGATGWDRMIRYAQLMIIASYMIPGVIKQFKSKGEWFMNSHLIGVQVVKTHRQNYYNDLDPVWAPEEIPKTAEVMLDHPNWTRLLLGCGVGLQLIAFLALYNRLTLALFGLMFVAFHYLNDLMFGLFFFHVEKMDWIFLVNLPFWIYWAWCWIRRAPRPDINTPSAGYIEPEMPASDTGTETPEPEAA